MSEAYKLSMRKAPSKPRKVPIGVVMVFVLMAITLYMAFAFPYTLVHLKHTDTSEIKSVIIVSIAGENSPSKESYFPSEEEPEELEKELGYEQLTNTGKERMFLLGKYLKLRYYNLLLNGNPRKIYTRSADLDLHLESAQALLAGLNPAKGSWLWSSSNELNQWQPKAIHTTDSNYDDLLSADSNCFKLEQDKFKWKNSTKYQQLLNEFRHDLQTLRLNTGLEFDDDLETLSDIEDSLKTRKAFKDQVPAWYSSTFANRLAHIADVTSESRFNTAYGQRLYVGRLLHEIVENVNNKIRLHQLALAASKGDSGENLVSGGIGGSIGTSEKVQQSQHQKHHHKFKSLKQLSEPNVFIYMTDKNRLSALLNSLQIYSSQPYFGSLLLIELHFDPINEVHFLRLFTISSTTPDSFPEPLRVNPIACGDSDECVPQQFEQNIRHLLLDKVSWQEACLNSVPLTTAKPLTPLVSDDFYTVKPAPPPPPSESKQQITTTPTLMITSTTPMESSTTPSTIIITTTTTTSESITTPSSSPTTALNLNEFEKLEEPISVRPTNFKPKPAVPDIDAASSKNQLDDIPILPINDEPNIIASTEVSLPTTTTTLKVPTSGLQETKNPTSQQADQNMQSQQSAALILPSSSTPVSLEDLNQTPLTEEVKKPIVPVADVLPLVSQK